ncbi:MAG: ribonuclease H-like domain-containing protein [Desulfobacterales bacterium]|nr:ribonuclease H-like domain-containing protein [Desulfobacterales bacterium]
MLEYTFCHLPEVGPATEQKLWQRGILTWTDALEKLDKPGKKNDTIRTGILESRKRLAQGDAKYFALALPAGQQYRLFNKFRQRAVFLDIETTGLSPWDEITTIALYDGTSVRYYVQGDNLDEFPADILTYGLIITYNGKTFDLPFIRARMDCPLDQAHIDLRYVLGSLGFKGGLKRCETAMGINRGDLDGVDGSFAVVLWQEYCKTGNPGALDTLLAYNIEDVINLETLMIRAYNLNIEAMGFRDILPAPPPVTNPFSPDMDLVNRLRSSVFAFR